MPERRQTGRRRIGSASVGRQAVGSIRMARLPLDRGDAAGRTDGRVRSRREKGLAMHRVTLTVAGVALAIGIAGTMATALGVGPMAATEGNHVDLAAPCNQDGSLDLVYDSLPIGGEKIVTTIRLWVERDACVGATAFLRLARDPAGRQPLGTVVTAIATPDPTGGADFQFNMAAQRLDATLVAFAAVAIPPTNAP
jgi:hypothetical protein